MNNYLVACALVICAGCQHCPSFCAPSCVQDKECAAPERPQRQHEREQCQKPAPSLECARPETITLKLPPQKIIVEQAPPPPAAQVQQVHPLVPPPAPYMQMQPQAALMAQQMVMVPQEEGVGEVAGRARPGLTLDFIRVPIPCLRLIAVPVQPRMRAVAVAPQSFVQPQSFKPGYPPVYPPQVYTQQVYPQQVYPQAMPYQAQFVQPQMQAYAQFPVQGTAVVPVQPQVIAQPQMIPVQPQAALACPPCPPCPGISAAQAEEFNRLVGEMKKVMEQKK